MNTYMNIDAKYTKDFILKGFEMGKHLPKPRRSIDADTTKPLAVVEKNHNKNVIFNTWDH